MVAKTDQNQKARLLDLVDLVTGVLELARDGKRDVGEVADVLQVVKDDPKFAARLLSPDGQPVATFPVWKTFPVGGATKGELLKRLEERVHVSGWERDIMGQPAFITSAEPQEVSFARVKVRDLGSTEMPTTTELFDEERLARFGLGLCEPEDGPYIRLADTDQPRGTWYWVAMPPITDSDGDPSVFLVERHNDGRQWLSAGFACPRDRWGLEREVVFRLSRLSK